MVRLQYVIFSFLALTLWSCGGGSSEEANTTTIREELTPAKGDRNYGGIFRLNESEFVASLFPHSVVDVYSHRVVAQIYEGLYKFDQKSLMPELCLAESMEVDESGTVYTVKLKKEVFFHDDACFPESKGRELKAQDVAYSFTRLCTQEGLENKGFHVIDGVIKGARAYYEASAGGNTPEFPVEGIVVVDDYTLKLTLESPNSLFKYTLARPELLIFPKEAYEKYGVDMNRKTVGTGPFRLKSFEQDVSIILVRHDNYHGVDEFGNKLPLLDALDIKFIAEKKQELYKFEKRELDMIYRLPNDHIIQILSLADSEDFQFQREPEMQTQMVVFMNQHPVFGDKNVRKAFSFAVDRTKILEDVLNGEGDAPGHHGITPPLFTNLTKETSYGAKQITGISQNIDSARYYLAKAGYKNGEGFPAFTYYYNTDGNRHALVAIELQKQLKDYLNINIELVPLPLSELAKKSLGGKYDIVRLAWVADLPHPAPFLKFFYSKNLPDSLGEQSFPNISRYRNEEFDRLYEAGIAAQTDQEAYEYFLKAEKLAMQDVPMMVLWYDEAFRLLQPYVKNFPNNPMQFRDLSEVYLLPHDKGKMTETGDDERVTLK